MTPPQELGITGVGEVIALAVAPVFVLSAIAGLLAVLTSRLARVIDRARVLEARLDQNEPTPGMQAELRMLSRRALLIYRAITLSIATAVLICSVVIVLFLGAFLAVDFSVLVALLFIGAMIFFLGGLLTLMRELLIATSALRFGQPSLPPRGHSG